MTDAIQIAFYQEMKADKEKYRDYYVELGHKYKELKAENTRLSNALEQLRKDVHGQAQAKIQLGELLHEEKAENTRLREKIAEFIDGECHGEKLEREG